MRRLIRVCLFAKINTLLVMVEYKIVYALIHFALIGDKSSKGAYEEMLLNIITDYTHNFCAHKIKNRSDL